MARLAEGRGGERKGLCSAPGQVGETRRQLYSSQIFLIPQGVTDPQLLTTISRLNMRLVTGAPGVHAIRTSPNRVKMFMSS